VCLASDETGPGLWMPIEVYVVSDGRERCIYISYRRSGKVFINIKCYVFM
jgi:hypothetical protein